VGAPYVARARRVGGHADLALSAIATSRMIVVPGARLSSPSL